MDLFSQGYNLEIWLLFCYQLLLMNIMMRYFHSSWKILIVKDDLLSQFIASVMNILVENLPMMCEMLYMANTEDTYTKATLKRRILKPTLHVCSY